MSRTLGSIDLDRLSAFCSSHRIARLALFGSAARDALRPDSDIDLLIEFEAGTRIGLVGVSSLELELAEFFCRKVDLRAAADLSRYFREDVVKGAEVLYAA